MPDSAAVLLAELPDQWKVTLPTGTKKAGTADEYAGTQLVTQYGKTPWFGPGPAGSGIAFRAPVNGVTTSGSEFPRSELREMNPAGSPASWGSDDGDTHTLTVLEAVTRIPNKRTKGTAATVSAQIHGAKDDVSVFRCEGSSIWVTQGNTTHFALADSAYVPGTPYEAKYVVAGGVVSAYYNGRLVVAFKADFAGAYFKAGAYTQANASNSQPGDATNYGETVIYDLQVQHGAPLPGQTPPVVVPPANPGPPAPAPDPTVQGPVIMIIRHGEKDDNADGTDDVAHALSKRGQQRALAIRDRGLFIIPRTDLAVPTYVLASQGGRMEQTAKPTADKLKLPVDVSLDVETATDAAAKLLVAKAKAGHNVWAIVEHRGIPALLKAAAKLLGCTDKLPSSHADDDFHTGYKFVGNRFTTFQESVLPGDPGYTVPAPPPVVVSPVVVPPVVVDPAPPVIPTPPPVEPPIVPEPPVIPPSPSPSPAPEPTPQPATRSFWQKFVDFINRLFQGM